ncbi:MAG: flagellar basal-body MS-ring/collar protein FliF [Calditrichia bacterium]
MAGFVDQLRENTGNFFDKLSFRQKLFLIISFVLLLTILMILFVWSNKPNYVTLFSNLNEKDAGEIIQKLQDKKVDYRVAELGNAILVPSSVARELRLELAKEGIPSQSVVGYELFDRNNLGMTDFVQKMNYRRALEGELSRTIQQIDAIDAARVHIVLPEKSLFMEDQQPTTASVVLRFKGKRYLTEGNIQAIVHLVASSVEGLAPENVTIVDTRGRVLSNNNTADDVMSMSSNQMELTKKVESYLAGKAQSMLDNILGPGNAIVRVTADLDFSKVEQTIEEFDPDNSVVRSEEIDETETPNAVAVQDNQTQVNAVSKTSTTITNYEISKTLKRVINEVGSIKNLSVAVVVNKKKKVIEVDGKEQITYENRSPQEIRTISELVKNAVGFRPERNDKLSVQSIGFSNEQLDDSFGFDLKPKTVMNQVFDYTKYVLVIAIIALSIMIIRSIMNVVTIKPDILPEPLKKLELQYAERRGQLPPGERNLAVREGQVPSISTKPLEEEISEEVLARSEFRGKIGEYVKNKPEDAARLLRVWIHEEEDEV